MAIERTTFDGRSRYLAGFFADNLEKISPDLVTGGAGGKVNSVHYDEVNAMFSRSW